MVAEEGGDLRVVAADNESSASRRQSARFTTNESSRDRADHSRATKRLRTMPLRPSRPSGAPWAVADTDSEFATQSEVDTESEVDTGSGSDSGSNDGSESEVNTDSRESRSPAQSTTSGDGDPVQRRQRRKPSDGARKPKPRLSRTNADNSSPTERGLDLNFRPINEIRDMFSDLVEKARGLGLGNSPLFSNRRPIRIATMCSGTESPLLACRLIAKGIVFTFL